MSWKFHFPLTETLLEHLITKDSFKTSTPTFDKIKTHAFFRDYASTFEQKHVELNATIVKQNVSFDASAKDFISKLSQKSEQRLKDEQKLVRELRRLSINYAKNYKLFNFSPQVKSQKRSMASQNQKHHNEEEKRKNKTRVSFNPLSSVGRCENSID